MSSMNKTVRVLAAAGAASLVIAGAAWSQEGTKPGTPPAAPTPATAPGPMTKPTAPGSTQPEAAPKPGFIPGVKLPDALMLEKTQHDWGEISDRTPVEYNFTVKNVSEDTIKINIAASCGCTVPRIEKNTLAPGEVTGATARFDPKGRSGTQTKTLTITVTEPTQKYASQSIVLTSTVKALVLVEPPKLHMQEVDHRNGATGKFKVTGRKEGFAVLSVDSNHPNVVAKIGEPKPVQVNGENLTEVEVEVEAGKGATIGDVMSQLTIKTNDERVEPLSMMVSAQVVGTARANPQSAFLRVVTPSTPFSTQVRVESRNGTAFKVRSIEAESNQEMSLATDVVPSPDGKYYMVTLAGVTPDKPGYVQGTIVVDTDIDGGETLRIPFSASIRNPSTVKPVAATTPAKPGAVPAVKTAVPTTGTGTPAPAATSGMKPSGKP